MNIQRALKIAKEKLQGFITASLDAELLLAYVLKVSRTDLHVQPEEEISETELQQFDLLVDKRKKGEPVAYLVGQKPFWTFVLKLTKDVLIPRAETELLVETALELLPKDRVLRVADIGTGSGAVALALAQERPLWHIVATDRSAAALAVARENARSLKISNIEFLLSDWFLRVPSQEFDAIVSNPPYVESSYLESYGPARFEPRVALDGGGEGLDSVKVLIKEAHHYLKPNGFLVLEHGANQGPAIGSIFLAHGYQSIQTKQDLGALDRVTYGVKPFENSA